MNGRTCPVSFTVPSVYNGCNLSQALPPSPPAFVYCNRLKENGKSGNEASVVACLISLQAFSSGTQVPENKLTDLALVCCSSPAQINIERDVFPHVCENKGSS